MTTTVSLEGPPGRRIFLQTRTEQARLRVEGVARWIAGFGDAVETHAEQTRPRVEGVARWITGFGDGFEPVARDDSREGRRVEGEVDVIAGKAGAAVHPR
jgi:hypothetical protein